MEKKLVIPYSDTPGEAGCYNIYQLGDYLYIYIMFEELRPKRELRMMIE